MTITRTLRLIRCVIHLLQYIYTHAHTYVPMYEYVNHRPVTMRLLFDVERLMAVGMVRSEARGSGGECRRSDLHALIQAAGPLERDTRQSLSLERETIVFRRVAIQNTWSILAAATNNGRLKWVCLAEGGLGKRDG